MKKLLLLAAILILPLATAASSALDSYNTNYGTSGVINAGTATWYVAYPQDTEQGSYNVAITVTTSTAATGNLILAVTDFQGDECTIGTFVADTASPTTASGYLPVITTGACHGNFRVAVSSGVTEISATRATIQLSPTPLTLWIPILGWIIAMIVLLRLAKGFAAFTGLLGLLNEVIPAIMPGSRLGYILLFILGLWLEAIAGDRLYTRWMKNREKTSGDDTL